MRIISGSLGGRNFEAPKGYRTHPMSDKVRGATFNILGDITDYTVLDAFAGSGALCFEAISRGAKSALAIEIDRRAQNAISQNIQTLGLHNQVKLVKANVNGWSENNKEKRFDIVFAAPPYDDLQVGLLQRLTKHVNPDGLYVLDWPGKLTVPELGDMEMVARKEYGDAQLAFYRPIS